MNASAGSTHATPVAPSSGSRSPAATVIGTAASSTAALRSRTNLIMRYGAASPSS